MFIYVAWINKVKILSTWVLLNVYEINTRRKRLWAMLDALFVGVATGPATVVAGLLL